ncbi:hypothetical protein F5B21DRAFT_460993, partial [Xylaria acuta]
MARSVHRFGWPRHCRWCQARWYQDAASHRVRHPPHLLLVLPTLVLSSSGPRWTPTSPSIAATCHKSPSWSSSKSPSTSCTPSTHLSSSSSQGTMTSPSRTPVGFRAIGGVVGWRGHPPYFLINCHEPHHRPSVRAVLAQLTLTSPQNAVH